jgi:hypothetical protein
MNKIEKIIYNSVKNNVALKILIKRIYQTLFLIVKPKKLEIDFKYELVEGYFFGFHDKSPWNGSNNLILAHSIDKINSYIPNQQDIAAIGYFEESDLSRFRKIGDTVSWNWQQGSMLQWLGGEDLIIYNDWDSGNSRNIARIVDLEGRSVKNLPIPVGAVSPDGKYAVSYDFERLNIGMPGYGYINESNEVVAKDSEVPDNRGFTVYSLLEEREIKFMSIKELNEQLKARKIVSGYIFVTHFLFSPDNLRFFFLLRSYTKGKRLQSRLISCNIKGEDMHVFPTGNMVSHLSWSGPDKVIAYCTDLFENEGYFLFTDKSDEYHRIGENEYSSDGHPQFQSSKESFVTDTYPNRKRLQELSIYHFKEKRKQVIGRFYTPMKFSEGYRCDLHPRWDRRGEKICIDTTFSGRRSMAIINLERD